MNDKYNTKRPLWLSSILIALLTSGGCSTLPNQDSSTQDSSTPAAPSNAGPAASANGKDAKTPGGTQAGADATVTTDPAGGGTVAARTDSDDLWQRVRAGYGLQPLDSPLVERHEQWFARNPEYLERMVQRANLYLYHIVEEVEKRGLPMEIALLPAIESAYQPHAYSRARASGLWQFIPSTGRLYGLKMDWWYDGRRDVMASTTAALDYLEKLRDDFDGDWHLALAAYNCGEGKVKRLMDQAHRKGRSAAYQDLPLPRETRNYVPKLIAMAHIVADPAKFNLTLASIPNQPYFARVETGYQVDLGVVAKLTDTPINELYDINPALNSWATAPQGPHALLVPADKIDALTQGLSTLPEDERVRWNRHEVRRGDTLSEIARKYGVSIELIRSTNNLRNNFLRVGQNLMIPMSSGRITAASTQLASVSQPSANGSRQRIVHRVRSGDTLSSIARRYNVNVRQLVNWNLLDAESVLRLGQKILIWSQPGPSAAIAGNQPSS